jgi:hypothetical protein
MRANRLFEMDLQKVDQLKNLRPANAFADIGAVEMP